MYSSARVRIRRRGGKKYREIETILLTLILTLTPT
jgi:hypothetical protein